MTLDVLIILGGPIALLALPWWAWRRERARSHPNPHSVALLVFGVEMLLASAVMLALGNGWWPLYFLVIGAGQLHGGWVVGRTNGRGAPR